MNNKSKLTTLAALGLIAGAMTSGEAASNSSSECVPLTSSQTKSLLSKLDAHHQRMFKSMDCEGQNLAMDLANQSCQGKNSCKGLNSCKTTENKCAGKGSCKGTSKGPFKDKNKAVEVAKKHMANKRMKSMDQ